MPNVGALWYTLTEHPIIGLIVFLLVTAATLLVLSGGRLGEALGGIFRVLLTFFTTPFVFLRNTVTTVRTAEEEEQHYERTRVFLMFRWNRINYMLLLIGCLILISGAITNALLTLYPEYEMQQSRRLGEQIRQIETDLATARTDLAAASAPDARQQLEVRRNEAEAAYQQQQQSNLTFLQGAPVSHWSLDQLARARSQSGIDNAHAQVNSALVGCPRSYEWRALGATAETCNATAQFAQELASRRREELRLSEAAQLAREAYFNTDQAAQVAQARVADLEQRLGYVREQRESVSLFNPQWLLQRGWTAIGGLIGALLGVIIIIWVFAVLLDVWNWWILIMRGLEKTMTEKLEGGAPSPRASFRDQRGPPPDYPNYQSE